jgi:hypothetical protein
MRTPDKIPPLRHDLRITGTFHFKSRAQVGAAGAGGSALAGAIPVLSAFRQVRRRQLGRLIFDGGGLGDPLRFAVDVGHGDGPERNQIDAGDEFGEERGQEFPVPSEQVNHQRSNAQVEDVIGGRKASGYEHGEDDKLEGVGGDGQEHGAAKVWAGRNGDGVVGHKCQNPAVLILDAGARLREAGSAGGKISAVRIG